MYSLYVMQRGIAKAVARKNVWGGGGGGGNLPIVSACVYCHFLLFCKVTRLLLSALYRHGYSKFGSGPGKGGGGGGGIRMEIDCDGYSTFGSGPALPLTTWPRVHVLCKHSSCCCIGGAGALLFSGHLLAF